MPNRLPLPWRGSYLSPIALQKPSLQSRHVYTKAAATAIPQLSASIPPITHYPPTQPPSHKPPEFRKSQLHRQYTSLLRSTPLMLLFQHNNLKATEWMGIRRELNQALRRCDEALAESGGQAMGGVGLAEGIKIHTIQTSIFAAALRVVEYYHPRQAPDQKTTSAPDTTTPPPAHQSFTHGLSKAAHRAAVTKRLAHELTPLLTGPLAVVAFPTVSPQHLKVVLSILAPSPPLFPAPKRRTNPGYHEPAVQAGLQKLLLLAARIEGKVFDTEGARMVGGIEGGMDGLRAQLVAMLQSVGAGVTSTLEAAGRSLYLTIEGRRSMLEEEEEQKGKESENTSTG